MWQQSEHEMFGDELFLAGERVTPGLYREIGGKREVRLDAEDILPASLDGRVACYTRIRNQWSQLADRKASKA